MIKVVAALSILFIAPASAASGHIFLPESGVVCDRQGGYCATREGISLEATGRYLGKKQRETLSHLIRGTDVNLQAFTLSSGSHCDTKEKLCYTDRYYPRTVDRQDTRLTHHLFGTADKKK